MLEVRNLTKYYKRIAAVDGISFTIRPGEVLGFLGPNGAGKSTTVKVLIGLIEPTQGEILFKGKDVRVDWPGFLRIAAYVPEEPNLYSQLTGR
jgi:ABC-2 type transport system ATP-binding protein